MKRPWEKELEKLNAVEIAKLEKDGLDVVNDIERFAQQGFSALTAADFDRLKWLGLYVQKPKTEEKFMLRVKVPGGILHSQQAKKVAEIAERFGQNALDITTRHSLQFHWIQVENLPEIFNELESVGLTTLQAAGDCPRNIVANPLDGVDPEEFLDTTELVAELNRFLHNNRDFSNLPRKFKVAISGGLYNSVHAEINDLSFIPAVQEADGEEIKGFHVLVGGGLSSQPKMAVKLDYFLLPKDVARMTAGVASLFRDYGYREKRNHSRLKFLLDDWGKERFQEELEKAVGTFQVGGREVSRGWNAGIFAGLQQQKQKGYNYLGLTVPCGRLSPNRLKEIAKIAEHYGDAHIRTTNTQDMIILNIPDSKLPLLQQEPLYKEQQNTQRSFHARTVVCTGNRFCPFAVVETKERMFAIADHLDTTIAEKENIRIHVSGCIHSCAQPQIADIGLQGTMTSVDGKPAQAFEICVGGKLGKGATFARKLEGKVLQEEVHERVAKIIIDYQKEKTANETFSEYIERSLAKENQ